MRVPFLDIQPPRRQQRQIVQRIQRVVRGGNFVLGDEVAGFENDWADYCGASECVAVGNGTDALELSLLACGVGPGDEVLVPERTFVATWMAVSNIGAIPISCPTDPLSGLIEVMDATQLVTEKTKAIVPVHLYGNPAELQKVKSFADLHSLRIVEDAAQAHGAEYRGVKIGAFGDAVAWSFYPGKNLGALGDAGAVTTNNSSVAKTVRLMRNYGSSEKYIHEILGRNSRMDEIQAAVLREKLKRLPKANAARRKVAAAYFSGLEGLPELERAKIAMPVESHWGRSSWHLFVVSCPDRDYVRERLAALGVETLIHYPLDVPLQPAYHRPPYGALAKPTMNQGNSLLSLPMGPHLTRRQVQYVIASLSLVARELSGATGA